MNKYHINKHGVAAVCRARSGNCPLGGDEQYFNSEQEAQEYANKVNEERYQMLPEVNNEDYIDEKYLPFYKITYCFVQWGVTILYHYI